MSLATAALFLCLARSPVDPEQKPLGPPDARMQKFSAEAAALIADAAKSGAPHEEAATAIYLVMRPKFGPANAALFNEREKKLRELATALKAEAPLSLPHLDAWADAVEAAAEKLTKAGFTVKSEPGHSAQLSWRPRVFGRRLIIEDPRRTTTAVPYAELKSEPAKPAHPKRTLWLLPLVTLRTQVNMVSREQPGELIGALEGATAWIIDPPQGGDVDDGKLIEAIRAALFPDAKPGAAANVQRLKGDEPLANDARVGLRVKRSGADAEYELVVR